LEGIYFVAIANSLYGSQAAGDYLKEVLSEGFEALNVINAYNGPITGLSYRLKRKILFKQLGVIPDVRPYCYSQFHCPLDPDGRVFPTILPNWDHTPRSGKRGIVLCGSTPEAFRECLHQKLEAIKDKPYEKRFLMVKSWNEWAEGNYLEPDLRYGKGYLEALKEELSAL